MVLATPILIVMLLVILLLLLLARTHMRSKTYKNMTSYHHGLHVHNFYNLKINAVREIVQYRYESWMVVGLLYKGQEHNSFFVLVSAGPLLRPTAAALSPCLLVITTVVAAGWLAGSLIIPRRRRTDVDQSFPFLLRHSIFYSVNLIEMKLVY